MENRRLPVGSDDFEKIRREGLYYVDKTLLIRDLLKKWREVNLFTRPRRFGKSLNMSMLQSFFEIGRDKSLFNGLAITDEKALCDEYMGKYPVVFVSFKDVDGITFEEAFQGLCGIISAEARRFQYLLQSERLTDIDKSTLSTLYADKPEASDVKRSLLIFSELLSKHYGQQVILLIDEYDVPLDKAYEHGYYSEMIGLIRAMFGQTLKTNRSLYFAVLTGCLRISKESIFTGLNNLKTHSIMDTQFDEFFGFTESEVDQILSNYELQDHRAAIKEWYDGYLFGEQDVYCPWDVINYCDDLLTDSKAEPQAYWKNTSGNDMVRRLIDKTDDGGATQEEIEKLMAGQSIYKAINDGLTHNEIDQSIENIWSVLFMTGYLTMVGRPSNGICELAIPNKEVRQIYMKQILEWFKRKARTEAINLTGLYAAFETGDSTQIKGILDEQLLDTVSYYDTQETFYHGFLLALLSTCANWKVSSNRETGNGRSDIKVERKDRTKGFIVELKDVKDLRKIDAASEAAIRQIEEKDYTVPLRQRRFNDIWIYGIAFCGKECRVIAKHMM
jgi:hypothetical protein